MFLLRERLHPALAVPRHPRGRPGPPAEHLQGRLAGHGRPRDEGRRASRAPAAARAPVARRQSRRCHFQNAKASPGRRTGTTEAPAPLLRATGKATGAPLAPRRRRSPGSQGRVGVPGGGRPASSAARRDGVLRGRPARRAVGGGRRRPEASDRRQRAEEARRRGGDVPGRRPPRGRRLERPLLQGRVQAAGHRPRRGHGQADAPLRQGPRLDPAVLLRRLRVVGMVLSLPLRALRLGPRGLRRGAPRHHRQTAPPTEEEAPEIEGRGDSKQRHDRRPGRRDDDSDSKRERRSLPRRGGLRRPRPRDAPESAGAADGRPPGGVGPRPPGALPAPHGRQAGVAGDRLLSRGRRSRPQRKGHALAPRRPPALRRRAAPPRRRQGRRRQDDGPPRQAPRRGRHAQERRRRLRSRRTRPRKTRPSTTRWWWWSFRRTPRQEGRRTCSHRR
mmetsp:Transcript_1329/g.4531  ORF Transcript_1329/g.4531 Transcript_1329/m.4531 type:complete len:446 (+) Transcript_1329:1095-2432(+)